MRLTLRLVLTVAALSGGAALAQPCPNPSNFGPDPPGRVMGAAQRAGLWGALLATLRQYALDPGFGAKDFEERAREARKAALSAPDDRSFYQRVRAFINGFGDGHLAFVSPAEAAEEGSQAGGNRAHGGIGVWGAGNDAGRLVIESVQVGSPAERAGLRAGDQVVRVNGACPTVDDVLGPVGTPVRLGIEGQDGRQRDVTLERAPLNGAGSVSVRRLPGGVAFLRLDSFLPDDVALQAQIELYKLGRTAPLTGLVIDLRSNGGGQLYEVQRFLGLFVRGQLGEYRGREGVQPLYSVPKSGDLSYLGYLQVPLAVLVSPRTASGGELAAAVLRRFAGATVLGQRTARLTTLATVFALPLGAEVHVPTADYFLDGQRLGETGVVPDVLLPEVAAASPDQDPAVARARNVLWRR